jgi:hypothetical protein
MANIKTHADYRKFQRNFELFVKDFKLSHLSTGSENTFSWDRCDCCLDDDGGDRYALYAHQEGNSEIVTFSVCPDCLYYANYGQLDDETMMRINS